QEEEELARYVQAVTARRAAGDHRRVLHQVADKTIPGMGSIVDARDEIGGFAEEGDVAAVGADDRGDPARAAKAVTADLLARGVEIDDVDGPGLPVEAVDAVRTTRGRAGAPRPGVAARCGGSWGWW